MGTQKQRREKFLREHPICAFCGGGIEATTEEHCPPRSMFQNAEWPEGFVFPACELCNKGTRESDHLFALCARVDPFYDSGNADGRAEKQISAIVQLYPDLARQVIPGPCEARKYNRAHGIKPGPGQFQQETNVVKFPPLFESAIDVVSLKLTKALYYRFSNKVFPASGCVISALSTNADLVRTGSYPLIQHFMRLGGISAPTRSMSGKDLTEQFQWKFTPLDDADHFLVQATFGRAFAILCIANPTEGALENVVRALRAKGGGDGPFKVLQSSGLDGVSSFE